MCEISKQDGMQSRLTIICRLTMRATLLTAVLLSVVLTGCSRITSSGLPKALNTDSLLQTAGRSQGIILAGPSWGESWNSRSVETERRFSATISSGTSGLLLAAYRNEVACTITNMGAAIYETGISGTTNDVRDFSFGYTWGSTDGIVRVYSFAGTNGQVQIVSFCYEHSR